MVLGNDVKRGLTDPLRICQNILPIYHMHLHSEQLVGRQRAGLVEDSVWHHGFANVVQHAANTNQLHVTRLDAECARETHQERTDTDRMKEGVVVFFLDSAQAQERIPVPQDRLRHLLYNRVHLFLLNLFALAYTLHQLADDLVGFGEHHLGSVDFLV